MLVTLQRREEPDTCAWQKSRIQNFNINLEVLKLGAFSKVNKIKKEQQKCKVQKQFEKPKV